MYVATHVNKPHTADASATQADESSSKSHYLRNKTERLYSLDRVRLRIFGVFKCHIDIRRDNHSIGHTDVFGNHLVQIHPQCTQFNVLCQ